MIFAAELLAAPAGDDIEHRALRQPSNGAGSPGGLGWDLARILIALAVVVAAIYLLLRLFRRFFPALAPAAGPAAPIRPLARFHLAPRQALHLVRCGRRLLLLGATATSINHIATIDDAEEIEQILAAIHRGESPFAGLGRFLHRPSEQDNVVSKEPSDHAGQAEV